MAVPFRRTSKMRKHTRRAHSALAGASIMRCPNCGASKQAHFLCVHCGQYDKKQIITKQLES